MYNPALLLELDFSKSKAKFNPPISAASPGESWLKVRPLQDGDYNRGFLELLSQLTAVGNVSKAQFLSISIKNSITYTFVLFNFMQIFLFSFLSLKIDSLK